MKIIITVPLLCLALLGQVNPSHAQGSQFTYQGSLTYNTVPATGTYDLRFTLKDAASGGNSIGSTITVAPIAVSNGLFKAQLDFGSASFPGAARWLEIGVRTNGSVAAYATLTPRQALTPTPYATMAQSVPDGAITSTKIAAGAVTSQQLGPISRLSAPDGSPMDALNVNNDGRIGIGTTTPNEQLEIGASYSFHAGGSVVLGFGYAPSTGKVLRDGSPAEIRWIPALGGLQLGGYSLSATTGQTIGFSPAMTVARSGSVGIGTTTPQGKLDVAGTTILNGPAANLDGRDLSYLRNSANIVIGWNKIGGYGEADFISNRGGGAGGGFAFWDLANDGTVNRLISLNDDGIVFPDGTVMNSAANLTVGIPAQIEITTLGASPWQVPSGVTRVRFRVWGAGGGGSNRSAGGGGGGGGGFAQYVVVNANAGEFFDLTVGAGGAVNAAGGLSKVVRRTGTVTLATANGGARGSSATGGAGGTAPTGQVRASGYAGENYDGVDYFGYGGGTAAEEAMPFGGGYGYGGNGLDPDWPSPAQVGEQGYILIEY